MKLRIHQNSLRLRLNRSDVEQFRKTGICAECLRFGSGSQLTYMAQEWSGSDQVSLSLNRTDVGGPSLSIEKDFQCLHRDETSPSDDLDAFPNPLAGDQCR